MASIKSRPVPPRMDRRWLVLHIYGTPNTAEQTQLLDAIDVIDHCGLVAEVQRFSNTTYLYAARRRKNNGRVED